MSIRTNPDCKEEGCYGRGVIHLFRWDIDVPCKGCQPRAIDCIRCECGLLYWKAEGAEGVCPHCGGTDGERTMWSHKKGPDKMVEVMRYNPEATEPEVSR